MNKEVYLGCAFYPWKKGGGEEKGIKGGRGGGGGEGIKGDRKWEKEGGG